MTKVADELVLKRMTKVADEEVLIRMSYVQGVCNAYKHRMITHLQAANALRAIGKNDKSVKFLLKPLED